MESTFLVPEPARQQEDTGRSAYFQSLNNGRLTHAPPPSPVSHPAKKTAAVEAPKPLKLDHKLVYKVIIDIVLVEVPFLGYQEGEEAGNVEEKLPEESQDQSEENVEEI